MSEAPDDADAHFNLAELLRGAGRDAEARRHYERARELGLAVPPDRLDTPAPGER